MIGLSFGVSDRSIAGLQAQKSRRNEGKRIAASLMRWVFQESLALFTYRVAAFNLNAHKSRGYGA